MIRPFPYLIAGFVLMTTICAQNGPYNFGDLWKSWQAMKRVAFLEGFKEGAEDGAFEILTQLQIREQGGLDHDFLEKYGHEAELLDLDLVLLAEVISTLYVDPANSYIRLSDMIYVARDKLRGNISGDKLEIRLGVARKSAQRVFEVDKMLERRLKGQ